MNEYRLSIKILLFGFPPLKEKYEVDNYVLKKAILDENEIIDSFNHELFSTGTYISFCTYVTENDNTRYYNYFENKPDIIKIPKKLKEPKAVEDYIINYYENNNEFEYLEKKLRLQFNTRILFPMIRFDILTKENKKFGLSIKYNDFSAQFTSQFFDEKTFESNSHLKLDIKSFIKLETKNVKFKRAIDYYFSSFDNNDISARFILLFSSLETLLLSSKKDLAKNLATCTSRILKYIDQFDEQVIYDEIIDLYDIRSKYIHGSKKYIITSENEKKLRDYVRATLLIYWQYVENNKLGANQVIKNLKQSLEFDFETRMFAKYLKVTDFKIAYKEFQSELIKEIKKGKFKIKEVNNDEVIITN